MIKNKFKLISAVLISGLALTLRLANYEGRTTYGWDQTRDVAVLEQAFRAGKLPLLGPVVRGDIGGFHLGPLYHYALIPVYGLSGHNPISLVWVSIALDVVVAVILGLLIAPVAGVIWAVSSLTVNASLTPWNVSLIHPWVLGVIYLISRIRSKPGRGVILACLFLLGVSTSIHLTLIPLASIVFLWLLPTLVRSARSAWDYLFGAVAIALPQIPFLISEYYSDFSELHGLSHFLQTRPVAGNYGAFLEIFFAKLGATVTRLFFGEPYLVAGILLTVILITYGIVRRRGNAMIQASLVIAIVTLISLLFYRDPDFAEYYLNALLIPLVIFAADFVSRRHILLPVVVVALIVYLNISGLDFTSGPFSMGVKKELMERAAPYIREGAEIRYLVPDYQIFGFKEYSRRMGIDIDKSHPIKVYIAPSTLLHVPSPDEAQSVTFQDKLAGFQLVVFHN